MTMMMTLSGQRSIQQECQAGKKTGACRGLPLGHKGPPTKPRKPFERPLAQRVISGWRETHVCQPSEGKRINCSPSTAKCVCELQSVPFQPRLSQPRLSRKRRDAPLDKVLPTLQLFPPEVLTSSTSHNIALRGLETQSDCHPHHHQPRHSHDENNDWPRRHHSLTPLRLVTVAVYSTSPPPILLPRISCCHSIYSAEVSAHAHLSTCPPRYSLRRHLSWASSLLAPTSHASSAVNPLPFGVRFDPIVASGIVIDSVDPEPFFWFFSLVS